MRARSGEVGPLGRSAPTRRSSGWSRRAWLGAAARVGAGFTLGGGLAACAGHARSEPGGSAPPGAAEGRAGAAVHDVDHASAFADLAGFCDGVPPVSAEERSLRVGRVAERMRDEGVDALLLEAGAAMSYFGGVSWGRSERPLQLVIYAREDRPPRWVVPAFEEGTLRERLDDGGTGRPLELVTWQEHASPFAPAVEGLERAARVAVDPELRRFVEAGWRDAGPTLRLEDGGGLIEGCRMVKSPLELARLRRANEATKAALARVAPLVTPGMDEAEIAALARSAQQAAGLEQVWVLALAGASAAFPHGARTRATAVEGGLVLVDTGGFLHGYASDITRTFPVGKLRDPDQRRAYAAVRAAQEAALAKIRPGQPAFEADDAARAVLAEAGFGADYDHFTHRLGHGIGLAVHEAPYLRRGNPRILQEGMTMSNEPGVYVPGAFGVRIEDIVVVRAAGAEVFGPRAGPVDAVF